MSQRIRKLVTALSYHGLNMAAQHLAQRELRKERVNSSGRHHGLCGYISSNTGATPTIDYSAISKMLESFLSSGGITNPDKPLPRSLDPAYQLPNLLLDDTLPNEQPLRSNPGNSKQLYFQFTTSQVPSPALSVITKKVP